MLCCVACHAPQRAAVPAADDCQDGRFRAELHGAYRLSLDWQAPLLACEGMPRPGDAGARLRFAGPARAGSAKRSLVFILGMPGLQRGLTARELPTNVTFLEEGSGRFFSTADTDSCWTDVNEQVPIGERADMHYRISGVTYCVSPLAELQGNAGVTLAELEFSGLLNWSTPE